MATRLLLCLVGLLLSCEIAEARTWKDKTGKFQVEAEFVWRTQRRLGVRPADADDAVQEVFVVAARRLGDIENGRERAFLFGIAARVASTRRRTLRRRPEDGELGLIEKPSDDPDPEELS